MERRTPNETKHRQPPRRGEVNGSPEWVQRPRRRLGGRGARAPRALLLKPQSRWGHSDTSGGKPNDTRPGDRSLRDPAGSAPSPVPPALRQQAAGSAPEASKRPRLTTGTGTTGREGPNAFAKVAALAMFVRPDIPTNKCLPASTNTGEEGQASDARGWDAIRRPRRPVDQCGECSLRPKLDRSDPPLPPFPLPPP